ITTERVWRDSNASVAVHPTLVTVGAERDEVLWMIVRRVFIDVVHFDVRRATYCAAMTKLRLDPLRKRPRNTLTLLARSLRHRPIFYLRRSEPERLPWARQVESPVVSTRSRVYEEREGSSTARKGHSPAVS